jgi:multidrug efflux system outer membrane protein
MKSQILLLIAGASLLSSCSFLPSVGPTYEEPTLALPETFANAVSQTTTTKASQPAWWDSFTDSQLKELLILARSKNLDLATAASRVREARALAGVTRADFFPQIDGSAALSRGETSSNSRFGGSFGEQQGSSNPFGIRNLYTAGFDASWEIDLFGGTRRAHEAALARVDGQEDAYAGAELSVLAEVARSYIDLRSFQKRVSIAERNIKIQQESLGIVQARFDAGLTSELDLAQARALLAETKAEIPLLEQGVRLSMHRLAVLLGDEPTALYERLKADSSQALERSFIPQIPSSLGAGIPSQLLRARPDIREAERTLAASTADIGVAVADFFPRFTLTGGFGYESTAGDSLFDSGSKYWSFGPGVRWPIFQGGRVLNNVRARRERASQALSNYQLKVLTALEETENALVSVKKQNERRISLLEAFKANQRAGELARDLYTQGLADLLRVLDADRATFITDDALAQSEQQLAVSAVSLYKAIGGSSLSEGMVVHVAMGSTGSPNT